MSHPLARYCSEKLSVGIDSLPPTGRKLRAGVEAFLSNQRNGGARDLVRRFRRLATFLRLDRENWPVALDRLLAMDYRKAEDTVTRYRKWVARKKWKSPVKNHMNAWGFVRLSRDLKRRGLLDWELKHVLTQARELRWENCCRRFRSKAEEWLRLERARKLQPTTLSRLAEDFSIFGNWLTSNHLGFDTLDRSDAVAWAESEHARNLSASTFNHRLSLAKRFYSWMVEDELIKKSPFEYLRFARISRRLPKVLEERDVAKLIAAAKRGPDRAVLETIYASGCRVKELCNLNLKDISFSERTARTIGKGGHDRVLYLNDSALSAIRYYLPQRERLAKRALDEDSGALFLSSTGTRFNPMSVRMVFQRTLLRAGLEKHVSPHMLRHAFATHLLNRGADLFALMQFLGHADIQSTVRYLQVATTRLSQVHRKFHPRR